MTARQLESAARKLVLIADPLVKDADRDAQASGRSILREAAKVYDLAAYNALSARNRNELLALAESCRATAESLSAHAAASRPRHRPGCPDAREVAP